jgi:peptide/nickel transport system permease protein
MVSYLIKRILLFLPTVFFVAVFAFILLAVAPGNPIDKFLDAPQFALDGNSSADLQNSQKKIIEKQLGLDLPIFYFTIHLPKTNSWQLLLPNLQFNTYNQFHRWFFGDGNMLTGANYTDCKGIVRGDFGISYTSKDKVSTLLLNRLPWSIFFTVLSVIFAYLISIPLGIISSAFYNTTIDKLISGFLFILPAIPTFVLATFLLLIFANPAVLNIFPTSGVQPILGIDNSVSFIQKAKIKVPYLILPLCCFTLGSIAFLSRTMRSSLLENLNQDYIRTAKSKGLSTKQVLLKHAFKNALLPIITVFAHVFPAAVAGSVIIETIFTIPGIGLTIFQAILSQDYPVVVAMFVITCVFTMLGNLVSDVLYAWADPRIRLN